jgi:RNA polymerase sigma-70 factor (ECF subfamily)
MEALALSSQPGRQRPDDPLEEFARAAAEGDLSATRRVLEGVGPRVLSVVRRVLGANHPDVEDVAQESLIALVRALAAFRGECSVAGYAARISVRTAVATRQRHQKRRERERDLAREQTALAPASQPADPQSVRLRLLRELLTELPAGQGDTLALRFVLGCSIKEIAETTQVPVNTVRSRLRLAKVALRRRIEDDPTLAEQLEITT